MRCFGGRLRARWVITCRVPVYGGGFAVVDVPVCWWHRLTLGAEVPLEISRRKL